jgi:hypothetical protein
MGTRTYHCPVSNVNKVHWHTISKQASSETLQPQRLRQRARIVMSSANGYTGTMVHCEPTVRVIRPRPMPAISNTRMHGTEQDEEEAGATAGAACAAAHACASRLPRSFRGAKGGAMTDRRISACARLKR